MNFSVESGIVDLNDQGLGSADMAELLQQLRSRSDITTLQ